MHDFTLFIMEDGNRVLFESSTEAVKYAILHNIPSGRMRSVVVDVKSSESFMGMVVAGAIIAYRQTDDEKGANA